VDDDAALVARLQSGDQSAFAELVRRYQPRLLRLAESTTGSHSVAQEATQDTWIAVLRGIDRFEARSSFKTWLFRILVNRSRTAWTRELRAGKPEDTTDERFDAAGAWTTPPEPWADRADDAIVANQLAARVHALLPSLPEGQRAIVALRDVEGLSAEDVTDLLGVSVGNQRVLLHRGRARLRALLATEVTAP
jgi:RNA polymerase sigma-70 factor (ECF subfamily)